MAKLKNISVKDNDFQHIEVIKNNRYKRRQYGKFLIEGVRNIKKAIEYGWEFDSFIFADKDKLSDWAKGVLKDVKADFHFQMKDILLKELSDKEETSEILALVKMRTHDFSELELKDNLLIAVFDRPGNPGNLGTVIRSCDSFKADALIITGHAADPYDPAVIKASVGSFFGLPIFLLESQDKITPLFQALQSKNIAYQIVGTSAKAEKTITEADFTKATFFIIGNETVGMSAAYKESCDYTITIPIYGNATSLNVGCATSIVLYEIDRQRRSVK